MINPSVKSVAFILSHGHAGSTLLGNVLGAHPAALHLGEIVNPIQRYHQVRCFVCGEQGCPIWNKVVQPEFVLACYDSFRHDTQPRNLPAAFRNLLGIKQGPEPRSLPGELFTQIFNAMPDTSLIVDGSKNLDWAEWNRQNTNFQSRYIFLRRDLRALVASRLRRGYDLSKAIQATRKKVERILAYEQKVADAVPHYALHYESLVTDPQTQITALCEFLEIPFSEEMLNYYAHVQHIFGGNVAPTIESLRHQGKTAQEIEQEHKLSKKDAADDAGAKYYSKQPGFKLDIRWKSQLTPETMTTIENRIGDLNRELGYD